MQDLTGFQRDLLVILAGLEAPMGLAIKDKFDEDFGTDINNGRLYPNLDRLAEQGFIEKGKRDDRTNSYSLTERGRHALQTRRAWEERLTGDGAAD